MSDFERRLYRRLPIAQLAMRAGIYWARELFVLQFRNRRMRKLATRMALRQLEQQVPDPELRAKLTPTYELGCKRILPTDEWYPALHAAERRAGHRGHRARSGRARSSRRTARSARSTRSSSAPAST